MPDALANPWQEHTSAAPQTDLSPSVHSVREGKAA
jgi:hypothetical protein